MRFRIDYPDGQALIADHEAQFKKGGLLWRGEVPAGLALFAAVELELRALGETLLIPAQVVQVFPGVGVALAFPAEPRLEALVARARGGGGGAEAGPLPRAQTPAPMAAPPESPAATRPASGKPPPGSQAEKIHKALYGNKDERAAIMRDTNRSLHVYLLRNPGLGLDEVATMARMTTISADVLKQIAERREWAGRPEIAIALVRNHAVPVPLAIRLLDKVSPADLKQLAKDTRTREPIQRAARKKVIGG